MQFLTRLAVLVSLVAATIGFAASADAADEMTVAQAGTYYLTAACPANAAKDRFYEAMFRGQDNVTLAQMRNRLVATKRAARRAASAEYSFARRLSNPPAAWPAKVQAPVETLVQRSLRLSGIFQRLGAVANARGAFYWYDRLGKVSTASPARVVRVNLNLPNVGEGC